MATYRAFLSCMIIAIVTSLASIYIYNILGFLAAIVTIIIAVFWLELGFFFQKK